MIAPVTVPKKHRSEHHPKRETDTRGVAYSTCSRCGMLDGHPYCPPGYWMTNAEGQAWDSMRSDDEREAFEVSLGRAP